MKLSARRKSLRNLYGVLVIFFLFQKGTMPEDVIEELAEAGDEEPDFARIRCPRCKWRPRPSSRWYCAECVQPEGLLEGCGTVWNTFDTRGRCPGCMHQWRWTACLSCSEWSPHEDWYAAEKD